MRRAVSIDDIRQMNEEYLDCHSYAEVARRTGWSASTVRKYIYKDFGAIDESTIHRFNPDTEMPEFSTDKFVGIDNYGELCTLSTEEVEEMKQLWNEMLM